MRAVAQVFVSDLDRPVPDADDRHHLERVLRLRAGEIVIASDGIGGWRPCAYAAGGRLEPQDTVRHDERPHPRLAVGFALVKGGRPEWIVQKLTECGVDRIVPFVAARSVVRWDDDKVARQATRLRRVAVEASMQSRRTWLPEVASLATFDALADTPGVALADLEGEPPTGAEALVLVGPEGGWDDAERARVGRRVVLGPTVLRAETAAVGVGVVLSALRAGIVLAAGGRGPRS